MGAPNESWPVDSVVQELDGTIDVRTGLPYIAKGTGPTSIPSYEIQYNRREQRLNSILAGWRQGMVVDEGGLKIGVYPIEFTLGGYRRVFAGASGVSVPDNAIKAVYLDNATALRIEDVWPSDLSAFLPLAVLETMEGQMSIVDKRVCTAFHVPSLELTSVRDKELLTARREAIGGNETALEVFRFEAPEALTLQQVQVYCSAVTATTSVDLKVGGSSMLTAPATPAAGGIVKPSLSQTAVASGAALSVQVTTNASGSVSHLAVTMVLKAVLTA